VRKATKSKHKHLEKFFWILISSSVNFFFSLFDRDKRKSLFLTNYVAGCKDEVPNFLGFLGVLYLGATEEVIIFLSNHTLVVFSKVILEVKNKHYPNITHLKEKWNELQKYQQDFLSILETTLERLSFVILCSLYSKVV